MNMMMNMMMLLLMLLLMMLLLMSMMMIIIMSRLFTVIDIEARGYSLQMQTSVTKNIDLATMLVLKIRLNSLHFARNTLKGLPPDRLASMIKTVLVDPIQLERGFNKKPSGL